MVDVDAIVTDTKRVQAVALRGEVFVALLIRVRIPPVVRSSTSDGTHGPAGQVLTCECHQAGRLADIPRQFVLIIAAPSH